MNHGFVTVLLQTFPGASGQMDVKMLLQPNSLLWLVQILKLSHGNEFVMIFEIHQYVINCL